jgi:ankyrin repeat protein
MDKEIMKLMRKAIKNGELNMVKDIVANNHGLLDTITPFGTWLHVASTQGKSDIVKYLIDKGLDVNQNGDIADCGAIRSAASEGHLDIVELLFQNGAKFDVSEATKSPLFGAIYGGHYDVVKFLVENGIDITVRYNTNALKNMEAYEYAREFGQTKIAEYLKEKLEQ